MNVLPTELWMQVFRETPLWPQTWLKQMTTCRLFHSLLEAKLYEDVHIHWDVTEEHKVFPKVPQATLFVQTLTARLELFSLVRKLRLNTSDERDLFKPTVKSKNNYWNHPVLWQLPYFPQLRYLELEDVHIDADCYTAIRSIPRLEHLRVEHCGIDAALQPFQGNTISKLTITYPKNGDGWTALMTPGLHTFIMKSSVENVHMDKVLRGLLSCDLRRTLTKLKWTLEDEFRKEFCQFIEPCVQLQSLSISYRFYPRDDAAKRSSHFEELPSGALPMLSNFGGSAEHTAAIMAGRSVHSVSLQLWDDTPADVLLALQLSKVPVTKLELSQEDYDGFQVPAETGLYLAHVPEKIEILSLHERSDRAKLQSWIPDLSNLSHLETIECSVRLKKDFMQTEAVRLLSEACPSTRKIFLNIYRYRESRGKEKWVWQNDGSWERYR